MRLQSLSFLLLLPLSSFAIPVDIFENKSWYLDSATLTTRVHEPVQGYDHSLSYITPDKVSSSTDMCKIINANTLQCITGDMVVADSENYSAILNNKFTYFEKGRQPQSSPLSGHWHSDNVKWCETDIIIPYASYNATKFYPASIYGPTSSESQLTYYLVYTNYKEFYFGRHLDISYTGYRMYDKNNKLIEGMHEIHKVIKLINSNYYRDCIYTKI